MLKQTKLIICSFIILITIQSVSIVGQENSEKPENKRVTIQMNQKPLYTVFYLLIQKYDVAIGLEESALDRSHRHYQFEPNIDKDRSILKTYKDEEMIPPIPEFNEHLISVNFKNAKLEDVMNSIVKQMKHYDWEMINGVVNIFPSNGRDPRLKKLLALKISAFALSKGNVVGRIQSNLVLLLPEIKEFFVENELEITKRRWVSSFENRILPDTLKFKDLTFKELLNAITKSKRGGWMLKIKKLNSRSEKEVIEILI